MSEPPMEPDAEREEQVVSDLRALWLALPAPDAAAGGVPAEALADCDAVTRAVVERVQAAYRAQVVAAPEVPFALRVADRVRRAPRRRGLQFGRRIAVAAALLVGAWAAMERFGARQADVAPPSASHVAGALPAAPRAVATEPVEHSRAAIFDVPREQLRQRLDGFEYRSGAVRIVLIQPTEPALDGRPRTEPTGD
ncbi:MAG: hypothetical protein R3F49_24700 [Planctomycetota bacterium]